MIIPTLRQFWYLTKIGSQKWIFNQQHLAAGSLKEGFDPFGRFTFQRNEGKAWNTSKKQQLTFVTFHSEERRSGGEGVTTADIS